MEKIARTLEYSVNAINGAAVENNNFCVTVHNRNVNPEVDMEIKLNSVIPFQNLKKMEFNKICLSHL
jgi:trehalose-6-phosphatase